MLLAVQDSIRDLPELLLETLVEHDALEELVLRKAFAHLEVRDHQVVVGVKLGGLMNQLRLAEALELWLSEPTHHRAAEPRHHYVQHAVRHISDTSVVKELEERREFLEMRIKVIRKQEDKTKERLTEMQVNLQKELGLNKG